MGHTGIARLCCSQEATRTRSPHFDKWWEYVTDPAYSVSENSDYEALGLYGNSDEGTVSIKNTLAVEIDNHKSTYTGKTPDEVNSDIAAPVANYEAHVAITRPIDYAKTPLIHQATSQTAVYTGGNRTDTVKVTWTLTDPGATDALTDNVYTFKYQVYQNASNAVGTPTLTGSINLTYAQMISTFGGSTVDFGFSASTATISTTQKINFVPTYPYTVNYYVQLANGTKTTIKVPTTPNPKTGQAPAGSYDIGPFPTFTNYTLVSGQTDQVTISATAANTYNIHYVDAAPIITGNTPVTLNNG